MIRTALIALALSATALPALSDTKPQPRLVQASLADLEAPAFRGRPLEARVEQLQEELALAHAIIARICTATPAACSE